MRFLGFVFDEIKPTLLLPMHSRGLEAHFA
jgi:hypothetical protein